MITEILGGGSHNIYVTVRDETNRSINLDLVDVQGTVGEMRYSNGEIFAYNGTYWQPIHGKTATVHVDPMYDEIKRWYFEETEKQRRLTKLCETYPALKSAKENFDIIYTLVDTK